ncbi:hypothetical protein PLESTF_001047700 [Pleodorina starrii]|nr:hypothetical protein PLESTF_001047700 [Pleodorina starrii]
MPSFSLSAQSQRCGLQHQSQSRRPFFGIPSPLWGKSSLGVMSSGAMMLGRKKEPLLQRQPVANNVFPFDQAWAPSVDAASLAPQLFAMSLFPYLCFLFFLTKSGKTPRLTLFGFYFLLVFVGATIPAGIYAKSQYGTSLANVDWLHGAAESLLTITNLLVVLGLRQGIREAEASKQRQAETAAAAAGGEQPQGAGASSTPAENVAR